MEKENKKKEVYAIPQQKRKNKKLKYVKITLTPRN